MHNVLLWSLQDCFWVIQEALPSPIPKPLKSLLGATIPIESYDRMFLIKVLMVLNPCHRPCCNQFPLVKEHLSFLHMRNELHDVPNFIIEVECLSSHLQKNCHKSGIEVHIIHGIDNIILTLGPHGHALAFAPAGILPWIMLGG